jgi:N-acetylmuramoyl-L-alanine amidase
MGIGRQSILSKLIILLPGLLLFSFFLTMDAGFAKTHAHKKHTVSRIVIDPGHGGKDPGAIGPNGEKEKNITLAVGKLLEESLEEKGFTVYMTRQSDVFIPLEERTAFANKKKVDLFVSIHVNANENMSSRGVETYFLNLTTDASSMKVAERENVMIKQSMSDLQFILRDLMLNARINESSRFASSIHHAVVSSLGKSGCGGKNNGVKQAPFYVLMGAQMPSALIEMGFITNAAECSLLQKRSHQESIVNGIVRGISSFISNAAYAVNGRGE